MPVPAEEMGFLSKEDWGKLGRALDANPERLKARYAEAVESHLRAPQPVVLKEQRNAPAPPNAHSFDFSKTFEATIVPGVLTLRAKADLRIGFAGERLCFFVQGQACYWALGWHCTSVDAHNLFCLRS